uniref:Uncharacterized protein n=1 Tax=Anguilla anguilla TaxID=7936 RepID=A0A0E9UAX5_ANGAN
MDEAVARLPISAVFQAPGLERLLIVIGCEVLRETEENQSGLSGSHTLLQSPRTNALISDERTQ